MIEENVFTANELVEIPSDVESGHSPRSGAQDKARKQRRLLHSQGNPVGATPTRTHAENWTSHTALPVVVGGFNDSAQSVLANTEYGDGGSSSTLQGPQSPPQQMQPTPQIRSQVHPQVPPSTTVAFQQLHPGASLPAAAAPRTTFRTEDTGFAGITLGASNFRNASSGTPGLAAPEKKDRAEVDATVRKELFELKKKLEGNMDGAVKTEGRIKSLKADRTAYAQGHRPAGRRKPGMSLINTACAAFFHLDGDETTTEIVVSIGEGQHRKQFKFQLALEVGSTAEEFYDGINLVRDNIVNTIDARQAAALLESQQKAVGFPDFEKAYHTIIDRNKQFVCTSTLEVGAAKQLWSAENQQLKQQALEDWKQIAEKVFKPEIQKQFKQHEAAIHRQQFVDMLASKTPADFEAERLRAAVRE